MKALFIWLSFLLLCLQVQSQEQFDINYTVDDGLPSNTVYAVEQDERGFIWFGTDAGLSRFDGYEFINYTMEDGLPDTEILNFFKDSQSRIWFYTLNGKAGFLKDGVIYSSTNTDWLKPLDFSGRISSIAEHDNKLFLSDVTSKAKILVNKVISKLADQVKGLPSGYTLCACNDELIALGRYHAIWIKGKDVSKVNYELQEQISLVYPLCINQNIYSFGPVQNKPYKISRNQTSTYKAFPTDLLNLKYIEGKLLYFLDSGIYEVDKDDLSSRVFYKDVPSATSMLVDHEKNEWYTSLERGVYMNARIDITKIGNIQRVSSINKFGNHLYVGHDDNTISRYSEGKTVEQIRFDTKSRILDVLVENSNNTWAKRRNGIYLNDGLFYKSGGRSLIKMDQLIYTGDRVGLYAFGHKGTKRRIFYQSVHLRNNPILSMLRLESDSLLLATDKGLWSYSKEHFYRPSEKPLLNVRIMKIAFDTDSTLWMATARDGIVALSKDGSLSQYTTKDGLSSNSCKDLTIEGLNIWVSTSNGLNKIEKVKYEDRHMVKNVPGNSIFSDINDIESFNDSIYIGTNEGLYALSHHIALNEESTFDVYIDKVLANGERTDLTSFDHTVSSIEITFKGLVFRDNKNLTYQYQLVDQAADPNSNDWITTSTNTINFSNLAPNTYSLWVSAKTKNSQWSSPVSYPFEIVPAFWQTLAFQSTAIGSIIVLALIGIQRYNKGRTFKKELERAKTKAEIKALKAQINPHFLFNALNSIQSFVLEGDLESSDSYLVKYGRLIRKVLDHSDKLTVTLSDELEMIELYIALEKLRFDKEFEFGISIDYRIEAETLKVPSMVIQPFLENAIWHGLSTKNGNKELHIAIQKVEKSIQIIIVDNGVGFDAHNPNIKPNHNSKGSKLVSERLSLIGKVNGVASDFNIDSTINEGTSVTLKFSDSLV